LGKGLLIYHPLEAVSRRRVTGFLFYVALGAAMVGPGNRTPWENPKTPWEGVSETMTYTNTQHQMKLSHNYGKSPFLMGKSTINCHFP